ncbi:MAG: hypothetical protein GY810_12405 [Aureispira sp.]|nr:hypothetical protein [Aureispira sp.]
MEETTKNPLVYLNTLPYLSILPLNEACLDMWALTKITKQLPVHLLANILGKYDFEVGIDLSIYINNSKEEIEQISAFQQTFQQFVEETTELTIGYPLLLMEDGKLGKPIAAPIFLWKIKLELVEGYSNKWLLSYVNEEEGQLNEVLKNYLETRFDFDWEQHVGFIDTIDSKNIEHYCSNLAKQLRLPEVGRKRLEPCPSTHEELGRNALIWSGTIGQLAPSSDDIEKIPPVLRPRDAKHWKTPISCQAANPEQEKMVELFFAGKHMVVEGQTQSGKTHTIAGLLPTVIADDASALVLSNMSSSLDEIELHLQNMGLRASDILRLDDKIASKEKLIAQLEALAEESKTIPRFNAVGYVNNLDKYVGYKKQLASAYDALHQKVVDNRDWTDIVGEFLQYHRQDRKQFLARAITTKDFEFSPIEYKKISTQLADHEPKFRKVGTLDHPMMQLHKKWFLPDLAPKAKTLVKKNLKDFYRRLRNLYHKYMQFVDWYTDDLKFSYHNYAEELEGQINKIEEEIRYYNDLYGADFDSLGALTSAKLRLLGMFSKRYQDIRAAKTKLYQKYEDLQDTYQVKTYFDAKLPKVHQQSKLVDLENKLEQFKEQLHNWRKRVPAIVQQQIQELSPKTPLKAHHKEELIGLEHLLENALTELNASGLLRQEFEVEQLRTHTREPFLQQVLSVLNSIQMTWKDFDSFYDWRLHWYSMTGLARRVVEALMKVYPTDWTTAFKSWYLHNLLSKHYTIDLLNQSWPIEPYVKLRDELKKLTVDKAKWALQNHRVDSLKQLKKEKDLALQKCRAIFQNKTLKEIIDWLGLETLTTLFPVILGDAELADELFEHKKSLFDVVMIDNADQLDAELGQQLIKLGAQRLALGAFMGIAEDNTDLLSTIAQENAYAYNFLEIIEEKEEEPTLEEDLFQDEVYHYLSEYLDTDRLEPNAELNGIHIDILIHPKSGQGKAIALICDGWMHIVDKYDYDRAYAKQQTLKAADYIIYPLWSVEWWQDADRSLQKLVAYVLKEDAR